MTVSKQQARKWSLVAMGASVGAIGLIAAATWANPFEKLFQVENLAARNTGTDTNTDGPGEFVDPFAEAIDTGMAEDVISRMTQYTEPIAVAVVPEEDPDPIEVVENTDEPEATMDESDLEWRYIGSIIGSKSRRAIMVIEDRQHMLREGAEHDDVTIRQVMSDHVIVQVGQREQRIEVESAEGLLASKETANALKSGAAANSRAQSPNANNGQSTLTPEEERRRRLEEAKRRAEEAHQRRQREAELRRDRMQQNNPKGKRTS